MLDQYRKDFPAEDKDLLPDNDSKMGRGKLLFYAASVAFAALLLFLMMGTFTKSDDSLAEKFQQSEDQHKEQLAQLDTKLQGLQLRLEKLERDQELEKLSVKDSPKKQIIAPEVIAQPFETPEDAVQMTSDALKKFIAKEAEESSPLATTEKAPSKKDASKGKLAKAKKSKEALAADPHSKVHTVQKGDTLSKISQRYFGTPNRWKSIYDANRDRIANMNSLKVGTEIIIPDSKQDG